MTVGRFQCAVGHKCFCIITDSRFRTGAFYMFLWLYFTCLFMHTSHAFELYGSYICLQNSNFSQNSKIFCSILQN